MSRVPDPHTTLLFMPDAPSNEMRALDASYAHHDGRPVDVKVASLVYDERTLVATVAVTTDLLHIQVCGFVFPFLGHCTLSDMLTRFTAT